VGHEPEVDFFKPRGVPLGSLEQVILTVDELEAIRLADLRGLYQDRAAEQMRISRQTFGRIIESAHRKVAEALIHGRALKIEGGAVEMHAVGRFECSGCRHSWRTRHETGRPARCPACRSDRIQRSELNPDSMRRRRSCRPPVGD
jgi:predicted DNA-binding protein (UPF0251 family)